MSGRRGRVRESRAGACANLRRFVCKLERVTTEPGLYLRSSFSPRSHHHEVFADRAEILRRMTNRPGPEGPGRPCRRAGSVAGRRRVAESHPPGRRPRRERVVAGVADASTTAAEDVTRGRPTALSRTGCRCASRTAGRSCRPVSRAARRSDVAGRRSGIRIGTAVASESWADARSRRFRQEGAYGPARQTCAEVLGRGQRVSCHRPARRAAMTPPSMSRSVPVMKPASGPSRKAAAVATSSAVPTRPVAETSIIFR